MLWFFYLIMIHAVVSGVCHAPAGTLAHVNGIFCCDWLSVSKPPVCFWRLVTSVVDPHRCHGGTGSSIFRSMRVWIQFRIRCQGFDDRLSKLVNFTARKKYYLPFFYHWPPWRTSKNYWRNFNPLKRTSSTSVHETSFTFLGHFCPGSGS
jgi:hypothetical protein